MAEITPKSCKSGHLPTNSQVCCILILKTGSNICTLSHVGLFLFKGPDYRTLLVANRFHKSLHFVDFNFLARYQSFKMMAPNRKSNTCLI